MKKYNIVLVGCGHMGKTHLRHIKPLERASILAVVDTDIEKAKQLCFQYGARYFFDDYRKAVCLPECDIVIVATYPSTHLQVVRECIRCGKHVLCEKPVAGNEEEMLEFIGHMKTAPVKILPGYILRHNKSYQLIHELIRNGEIGSPLVMRMTQNHRTADWPRYRRLIQETSPLVDCGVHYLDAMEWMTGAKIESISAAGAVTERDLGEGKYNYGIMTVTFSDGSVGYYEAGWGNTVSAVNEKEFIGPKGSIRLIMQYDRVHDMRRGSVKELADYSNEAESTDYVDETGRKIGDLIELYRYPEAEYRRYNVCGDRKPTGEQLMYLINMIEKDLTAVPSADEVLRGMSAVFEADRQIKEVLMRKG